MEREFQSRKALPILLRALAFVQSEVSFELRVLGDGPMEELWTREVERLGLRSSVRFMGPLPFTDAVAQMHWAELFCFTSLRDTSGNVVLEALAAGVPVVCFDHQGAGDMVSETCGVKVAVSTPKQAVMDWAQAIRGLAGDAGRLLRLSEGTTEEARKFLWDTNGDWVNAVYRRMISGDERGRIV